MSIQESTNIQPSSATCAAPNIFTPNMSTRHIFRTAVRTSNGHIPRHAMIRAKRQIKMCIRSAKREARRKIEEERACRARTWKSVWYFREESSDEFPTLPDEPFTPTVVFPSEQHRPFGLSESEQKIVRKWIAWMGDICVIDELTDFSRSVIDNFLTEFVELFFPNFFNVFCDAAEMEWYSGAGISFSAHDVYHAKELYQMMWWGALRCAEYSTAEELMQNPDGCFWRTTHHAERYAFLRV